MTAGTDPTDYYLQLGEIVDVSNPGAIGFKTKNLAGKDVTVTLDWETEAYPNRSLARLPNDRRGMLKATAETPPMKKSGTLYIAAAKCDDLDKRKYPSELANGVVFHRKVFNARQLILECVNTNGEVMSIDLLMPSRADLSRGVEVDGERFVAWISDAGFEDIGENPPSKPGTESPAPAPAPAPSAASPLARVALEYCSTLPDAQLRAALVPLLKLLAGAG
jgi:hypothetical protein